MTETVALCRLWGRMEASEPRRSVEEDSEDVRRDVDYWRTSGCWTLPCLRLTVQTYLVGGLRVSADHMSASRLRCVVVPCPK